MNLLRDPLLLFLASLLVGWGIYAGSAPPQPLPSNVPEDAFAAGRAELILAQLYDGLGPHVSGSAANAELRDRIVSVLELAGYQPEIQSRYHCNPMFATCSPVQNIIARLPGSDERHHAILLTAHYDSGWAGPGVADDGAGVAAVLEIARMAAANPVFNDDLIFLLSDAEEQGLIGAHAFAERHPLFESVRAVINLEARGISGSSAMFETTTGNRGIIRLLAKNLDRPVANSLTYEIYRRMPNDTDFSVYRTHQLAGVNFAFSEGVAAYHSRADDLARLDRASLQHHGQNAWSVLTALNQRTLEQMVSPEDAVYVDVFSRGLLHYPVSTAAGLVLVISVLVLVAIRRSYARQITLRQVFWCLVAVALLVAAVPAVGWLLSWPLGRWPDQHPLDHPWPWVGRLVHLFAAVWILRLVVARLAPRASTGTAMLTCWSLFALLALSLATSVPAASFVGLLPLLAFMIGLALDGFRWRRPPRLAFSSLFGFLGALYVGFYLARMLETVAGLDQSALRMAPLVLPAVAALPLLVWYADRHGVGRGLAVISGFAVVAGCVGQWFLPAYSPDRPRDMSVYYYQDAGPDPARQPAWMILESRFGTVDPAYQAFHAFKPVTLRGEAGEPEERLAVPADPLDLPGLEPGGRRAGISERAPGSGRFVLDLDVPQGLRQLSVRLPPGSSLQYAAFEGQVVFDAGLPAHRPRRGDRLVLHQPPLGPARVEMEFDPGAVEVPELVVDARFDLPRERLARFSESWPADAEPAFLGPRAVIRYRVPLAAEPAAAAGADQAMTR